MVVTAHPDDAEFGVAGTVAAWTRAGRRVVYVVCTNGDKGSSDRAMKPEVLARIREREQSAAAELLGVETVVFLRRPDQGLEDSAEFRQVMVRLIRTYRPEIIVTSDPYRRYLWHRDHRVVGQVVMDAVFPLARDHMAYPNLLTAGLEPHKVREVWYWAAEDLNHRVDITATFDLKLAALRCHQSQVTELNRPDLEQWLQDRCRANAESESFELAEAFHRVVMP
ncbi:MAG: PIG-L domain-containing protein [Syntrophobacteraceae bacterium CG2_30_61_12]|nr:MAG: PIG-L domain-containing protein [Syntrophobacteraceae bacterium CG2_30_61_12]